MEKLEQKWNESRKAWREHGTAFGARTKRATAAFATDTREAFGDLGEFAREELKAWAGQVLPNGISVNVPVELPPGPFSPREFERAFLSQLVGALDALMTRAKARLAQLDAVELAPLPGYDTLSAKELVAKLERMKLDKVGAVRAFEGAHKARATVLRACDRRLAN